MGDRRLSTDCWYSLCCSISPYPRDASVGPLVDPTVETPYMPSEASKSTQAADIRLRTAVGYFEPTVLRYSLQ